VTSQQVSDCILATHHLVHVTLDGQLDLSALLHDDSASELEDVLAEASRFGVVVQDLDFDHVDAVVSGLEDALMLQLRDSRVKQMVQGRLTTGRRSGWIRM
jgi:hypothetical protein